MGDKLSPHFPIKGGSKAESQPMQWADGIVCSPTMRGGGGNTILQKGARPVYGPNSAHPRLARETLSSIFQFGFRVTPLAVLTVALSREEDSPSYIHHAPVAVGLVPEPRPLKGRHNTIFWVL